MSTVREIINLKYLDHVAMILRSSKDEVYLFDSNSEDVRDRFNINFRVLDYRFGVHLKKISGILMELKLHTVK